MFEYKYVCKWFSIFALAVQLIVSGCSDGAEDADSVPGEGNEVSVLQGEWMSGPQVGSSNEYAVVFDGNTLRVRGTDATGGVVLRQSVGIAQVDQERSLLILDGVTAAWPYSYKMSEGQEVFELEFFNTSEGAWNKIKLQRQGH